MNSFFTDLWSEMIKPLLPIYLKVILQTPVWMITLFNTVSEFLANIFKIIFWIYSDKQKDKKKIMLIWYAVSNMLKPLMFLFQTIFWVFFIELLNRIWKWIRSAPKEVLMTYSIEENKLWKGFWFQKAMDSFWAFVWTILISIILFIFWLDYETSILWFNINIFYIILFITLIPWIISYQIIVKKVRNVYMEEQSLSEFENKKKKKIFVDFSKLFQLGSKFNALMIYTFLLSIWNIALVFFILELLDKQFLPYQITLFYSLYTLVDALFSYEIWKLSDKKWYTKYILATSIFFIFLSLLLTFVIWIDKTFIWIIVWILVFSLLGMYEAAFEWTFKKLIAENVEKESIWTAMWMYFWVAWITKIIASLIFAIAWTSWKSDAVFWFWFLFVFLSSIYLYYLYKTKSIKL